jgi:hypothetical protein
VGLFGFLRRNDQRAMPEPGTPEFEQAVAGTAIRDSRSVAMGEPGWTAPGASRPVDVRDTGQRQRLEELLRQHGIDPDEKGQVIDASQVPGLSGELIKLLLDPRR